MNQRLHKPRDAELLDFALARSWQGWKCLLTLNPKKPSLLLKGC